jgi:AcrR family transcriptional regulator
MADSGFISSRRAVATMRTAGRPAGQARPAPPVRTEPLTERGRQSRQRILDAAERVFGQKGYFPASITDITREAGVAQGTFYVYFKSKQDVFVEVLETFARTIRATTRAALDGASNRVEEEERGFAAFFSIVDRHPQLYRIVRQAEFIDPGAFRRYYSTIVRSYAARLRAAMDRGEVRAMDTETLAYCLLGVGDLVGMRWPYWTGKPIPHDVFESMMQFIRHGIDPGRDARPGARKRHKKEITS